MANLFRLDRRRTRQCRDRRLSQGMRMMSEPFKGIELPPIHPGEILREEYLLPLEMSAGALARRLQVPRTRIERIVAEETAISPDTALRLARFFATTPDFWMNMQVGYDLAVAKREKADLIAAIEPLEAA